MAMQVEKWGMYELEFNYDGAANPFMDVSLAAEFTCGDSSVKVSGFYDGDGQYKLRFMPAVEGIWHYVTQSNIPALNEKASEFLCVAPAAGNHGPVQVAHETSFSYADGTRYLPVGTTCYVWNLQGDELEEQTLKTLKTTPFNKIRMCVFPKRYEYNQNEPPSYPFPGDVKEKAWDLSRFNPEYFQHLEQRILDLQKLGIEADLILFHPYDNGAWGFDKLPMEVNDRYLHYLVARLGAIRNVWWSFANEYDLFPERTHEDWDHYMQLVQEIDPYHHLRSIHNCFSFYDHSKPWVTHCSIQHDFTNYSFKWMERYHKPVIIDECGYEGNNRMTWGDLSPEEMVLRFWNGFCQGGSVGHGETYVNDESILWWSKGGLLSGTSVPRIAFLREIFENAPLLTSLPIREREDIDIFNPAIRAQFFTRSDDPSQKFLRMAAWQGSTCGFNLEAQYFIFYFGTHQPSARIYDLPEGNHYKVDLIDTWNMTIKTVAEHAAGQLRIEMPTRKFMAIRIEQVKG